MPDSIDVVCDGVVFATIVSEDLPAAHTGRQKIERDDALDTVGENFPSTPTRPKKRRSRKKSDEVILEID